MAAEGQPSEEPKRAKPQTSEASEAGGASRRGHGEQGVPPGCGRIERPSGGRISSGKGDGAAGRPRGEDRAGNGVLDGTTRRGARRSGRSRSRVAGCREGRVEGTFGDVGDGAQREKAKRTFVSLEQSGRSNVRLSSYRATGSRSVACEGPVAAMLESGSRGFCPDKVSALDARHIDDPSTGRPAPSGSRTCPSAANPPRGRRHSQTL
jgi:hypothetical protein